jgi:hypothetical protein
VAFLRVIGPFDCDFIALTRKFSETIDHAA